LSGNGGRIITANKRDNVLYIGKRVKVHLKKLVSGGGNLADVEPRLSLGLGPYPPYDNKEAENFKKRKTHVYETRVRLRSSGVTPRSRDCPVRSHKLYFRALGSPLKGDVEKITESRRPKARSSLGGLPVMKGYEKKKKAIGKRHSSEEGACKGGHIGKRAEKIHGMRGLSAGRRKI